MEIDLKYRELYKAVITLSGLKIIASNPMVQAELEKAGFDQVKVTGIGKQRTASGRWAKPTQTATIPKEVSNIEMI